MQCRHFFNPNTVVCRVSHTPFNVEDDAKARHFSSPGPIATDTGKHQCVVWEPIYDWMASRAFNPSQPGLLVHPIFGKHN